MYPIRSKSNCTHSSVTVNHEMDWDENIKSCITDANRMIGWITRNILNRDPVILTRIYKTIIRPKLEYCVQLWNPAACQQFFNNFRVVSYSA